jgi:hypothetical protein
MNKSTNKFAMQELKLAGLIGEDAPYGGMLADAILELLEIFDRQGHSGASAPFVISAFSKLAMGMPLTPLTGNDDEWIKIKDNLYQSKRMPTVFKDDVGMFNINAIQFVNSDGDFYFGTGRTKDGKIIYSHQYFKPPLLPKTFIVHVDNDGIVDEAELEEAFKMYIKNIDKNGGER